MVHVVARFNAWGTASAIFLSRPALKSAALRSTPQQK
jgi:hypothetical protein